MGNGVRAHVRVQRRRAARERCEVLLLLRRHDRGSRLRQRGGGMSVQANKEAIRKWVEALRSGEFQQGKDSLRPKPDAFCCLGVACEVFRRETGKGEWAAIHSDMTFVASDASSSADLLPTAVAEWMF